MPGNVDFYETIIQSDFGWGGSLLGLAMIMGISYALSRKSRDMMLIQFPITLSVKLLLPLFSTSIVIFSFALFVMNMAGSKRDILAEVKNVPQKIRDKLLQTRDMTRQAKAAIDKDLLKEKYKDIKLSQLFKYNR